MPVEKSTNEKTRLSGTQKAAALLLVMGKDTATKLANYFSPEEIDGFVKAASSLRTLEAEAIDSLVSEFQGNFTKMGMLADADDLSDFFKQSGPEEAPEEDRKETPKERVGEVPSLEQIEEFLSTEPDYMSVFLLSTLGDEFLAEVFSTLETERRKSLFKLYIDREPSDPDIEADMREALFKSIANSGEDDGSEQRIEAAAGVMNYLPDETGEELMDFINSGDPRAAEILKKSMFRFSEILGLTKETRSIIFDGVEPDVIVPALQGADEKMKEVILDVLSQRNRRMIEAELARAKNADDAIQAAQRQIASTALGLAKEGRISLEPAGEGAAQG